MTESPPIRRIAGAAALVLGGSFLLFLMWKLRGHDEHVRAFTEVCLEVASTVNASGKSELCEYSQSWYFKNRQPFVEIAPGKLAAPELPGDSQVRIIAFQNPKLFAAVGFCYFTSRGWLEETGITPLGFASSVGGMAILAKELYDYNNWVRSPAGIRCRKSVEAELGYPVPDLTGELKARASLIALNPAALVSGKASLEAVLREAKITINHERIHALQALCQEFQEWSELEWEGLKEAQRKAVRERHPEYAWGDPFIAARELIAFRFEQHPAQVNAYLGNCKFPQAPLEGKTSP